MMKSILTIRPKDQAEEVTKHLTNEGFNVTIEPTFKVEEVELLDNSRLKKLSEKQVKAIILTSVNASQMVLRVINDLKLDKNIKIFAVGKRTVKNLISAGYNNVITSEGKSAEHLEKLMLNDAQIMNQQEDDILLYFCGEIITLDFQKTFSEKGVNLEKILSYKIIQNQEFSEKFLSKCTKTNFDYILLYSHNSAKHFFELLKRHNLLESFQNSQILCLSTKILSFVRSLGFNNSATFEEISILKKFYD